jgi:hypothetical protein
MKKSQFLHTAVLLSVLLLLKDSSLGTISPGFRTFLRDEYGGDVEKMIARDDLGDGGSFGGGDHVAGKATK